MDKIKIPLSSSIIASKLDGLLEKLCTSQAIVKHVIQVTEEDSHDIHLALIQANKLSLEVSEELGKICDKL
jgi:hypothetical protein